MSELSEVVAAELAIPSSRGENYLPPVLEQATLRVLEDVKRPNTSFSDYFQIRVDGNLSDDDWGKVAIKEFGRIIADQYLEAVYRAVLHDELGWEPDEGTTPESIIRARRVVELLQRITTYNRRGRKPDDPAEARQLIQQAVDLVKARGERLTRASIAAEIPLSTSGLDCLRKRHRLEITKDGRVEFSAIN